MSSLPVPAMPYQDLRAMAKDIAASGLFGLKNETQVMALMAVAQAEGKHPAIVARDFDIIQGKPAKKSDAMLRDFLESGGKVEWHKLDDTTADATFSHPAGGAVRISWDMARAKTAELAGKDMWKKYPRQMLRARTVSEGVRTVWPLATSGFYVPEEVRDFTPTASVSSVTGRKPETIEGQATPVEQSALAQIPAPPEGYDAWADGMNKAAGQGEEVLDEAWKKSPKAFKAHSSKHDTKWASTLREVAKRKDYEKERDAIEGEATEVAQ